MKRIAIFASGAGSNAQAIIDHFRESKLAKVELIVSNKPGAGVVKIAEKEKIKLLQIETERFFSGDHYLPEIKDRKIDLIALAGFLWKIPQALINNFPNRIINIHPALLPKYGGKGMYGLNVHQAVLNAKEKESGITIHYVDGHYDHGDIILQVSCPVHDSDTPESLAERIHKLEHRYYAPTIQALLEK